MKNNNFAIEFYTKPDGTDLIKSFLDDLPVKLRVKAYGALALLEEYGNEIREPYSKDDKLKNTLVLTALQIMNNYRFRKRNDFYE